MQFAKPVGRNAAVQKYDVLTALGSWALGQSKTQQRTALRLITLITARYNWQRDRLAVGQHEIARLWSCDVRTVKREMARLRAIEWLSLRVQGRRGRVAEYSLGLESIFNDTRPSWANVGPDFACRLETDRTETVVPLMPKGPAPQPDIRADDEWSLAAGIVHREDPALYGAWIHALVPVERAGGVLKLKAPSRFHAAYVDTHLRERLLQALCQVGAEADELRLVF